MDPSGTRKTMRRSIVKDILGNLEIVFYIAVIEGAQGARYLGIYDSAKIFWEPRRMPRC